MRYEVPIGRVDGRRRGRDVEAVIAVAGLVVAIAVGAAVSGARPAAVRSDGDSGARPTGVEDRAPATAFADGLHLSRPAALERPGLPADLDCRDLAPAACRRVATAALAALPADLPPVRSATAWRSLVCGDATDCPSRQLARAFPLGSVIVAFVDGSPPAAINVVEHRFGPNIRLGTRAWLLDWAPIAPGD